MNTTLFDLGKKIRIARLLRGYSQENVALELGIRQQTYHLLENGKISISKERLEKIATILNVQVEFIEILDNVDWLNNLVLKYNSQSSNDG